MLKITIIAALSAAALSPAMASPRTAVVRTADLNIASPTGRAALERRINHAAGTVCGTADPRNLKEFSAAASCKSDAAARALAQAGISNDRMAVAAR